MITSCEHNHFGSPCWQCLEKENDALKEEIRELRNPSRKPIVVTTNLPVNDCLEKIASMFVKIACEHIKSGRVEVIVREHLGDL